MSNSIDRTLYALLEACPNLVEKRDDLVLEAEKLAAAANAGAEPGAAPLPVKQHAEAIEQLRAQWKELDRLSAATSRDLWQRFDAALKTAYQPVAAHLDKLNAARRENLDARKKLLAALDAVKLADADSGAATDWRAVARALAHFQTDWRKLGPLEHTLTHKDREPLAAQMQASVSRLETPLQEARRAAQAVRESYIASAKALSEAAQSRDIVARVRALQAEWQQHAKVLPLARDVENALWAEFKTALDAVFGQRDAAFKAREAELKAGQAAREALIARLEELGTDMAAADIKRAVAEIGAEWRKAGEAPHALSASLESRFRAASEAALGRAAAAVQRAWNEKFDALLAKVALCEEVEANVLDVIPLEDVESRWAALPALSPAWDAPLTARYKAAIDSSATASAGRDGASAAALDAILLRLEAALDIATPPAFQAARQAMKLQAMKSALEGGKSAGVSRSEVDKLMIAAIEHVCGDAEQSRRLAAILGALRSRGPL